MAYPLASALLAERPQVSSGPAETGGLAELEADLVRLIDGAEAAWPELGLDRVAFAAYLGARLGQAPASSGTDGRPDDGPTGEAEDPVAGARRALAELHVDDLYLASACAQLLPNALLALERDYFSRLRPMPGGTDTEHDEVKQVLRERLLVGSGDTRPRILQYSGAGKLAGWLQVAATRLAVKLRRDPATPHAESELEGLAVDDARIAERDPELAVLHQRYRGAFRQAFESALRLLPAEERTLLRLYLVDRLNIDRIGAMFGIHRATAARRLAAARQRIFSLSQEQLQAELAVSSGDALSLMRLLQSSLDVSVARILCEPDGTRPDGTSSDP